MESDANGKTPKHPLNHLCITLSITIMPSSNDPVFGVFHCLFIVFDIPLFSMPSSLFNKRRMIFFLGGGVGWWGQFLYQIQIWRYFQIQQFYFLSLTNQATFFFKNILNRLSHLIDDALCLG
jgi:hypothetical protein